MAKNKRTFWVIAKETINNEKLFCVYSPVYDDRPHINRCVELQKHGRHINIETPDANTHKENIIKDFESRGYKLTTKDILFGQPTNPLYYCNGQE